MKTSVTTRLTPVVVVLLSSALVHGCRCGPGTQTQEPDFFPTPAAISFEACPTKDETGATVADVFPDVQKVSIENRGTAGAPLKLSIIGADATMFTLGTAPERLEANATTEVPISFSPSKKGDLKAELRVDDGVDGGIKTVTLIGTGKNLPAQATIETSPQKKDATGYLLCQEGSPLSDCTLEFPDTPFAQATTLQVKIKNTGCPALKITGLAIESSRGDTQGFSIDSPSQLPSATQPIVLSTADGTQEMTVTIRFSPTDDNSGNNSRDAALVILSNDKANGDGFAAPARIALTGMSIKSSYYTTPTFCDFSNPTDLCGFPTAQTPHDKARFRITNDGTGDVTLSKVSFRSTGGSSGVGGRFTISQNVQGTKITPGMSATLEVTHNDMPLYVSDQIDIEGTVVGLPPGKVTVAVYGGKKPCLTTEPLDQMNFQNPTTELSAQPFRIKNGANCGTLIINSVSIDTNAFFSIIDPVIAPNTQVPAGGSVETTVQYKRPNSGGMQLGTLHVTSNDSDFGPPQYKLVQLYSSSPLDQLPSATLTACNPASVLNDPNCTMGAQTAFATQLSMLTRPEITLSGFNSTDDNMVKEYRFTLLPPFPGTVTSAALANNNTKITTPTTKLTIPLGATGLYRVQLEVFDDRGQRSANQPVISLNIYP